MSKIITKRVKYAPVLVTLSLKLFSNRNFKDI